MLEDVKSDVNVATGAANVRACSSTLTQVAKFANSCDVLVRSFDNHHYAIDAAKKYLHLYKEKE